MFYKTKQLKEYWGVSQGKYYYLLEKFGISHINRKPKTKKGKVKNEVSEPNPKATPKQTEKSNMFMDSLITEQINKAIEMHLNNINNKPKEETNNIITSKTGIIHGERLYTLLIKMADFLDRNENYDILFKIKEK
jgi:hypothetical protein